MSSMLMAGLLTGCAVNQKEEVAPEVQPWSVDRFADIEVLRYEVPAFEELPLAQKELIYYLTEAAQWGRDILWDQNCRFNLPIRNICEAIYLNYQGDKTDAFIIITVLPSSTLSSRRNGLRLRSTSCLRL